MITGITVEGVPADPAYVVSDITVMHGRKEIGVGPEAGSLTVRYVVPGDTLPESWSVGDRITAEGDTCTMFTGRITERTLSHGRNDDGTPYGLFSVTAAGPVAALGYRNVGDEPWPVESGTVRAERILKLAKVPYIIDGVSDGQITARDVDSRPARTLLEDLAASTGAAVVDLPTGLVAYQPLADRALGVQEYQWQDFPPSKRWDGFSAAATWADFATLAEHPVQIPGTAVEWEPEWSQSSGIVNRIRVGYGTPAQGEDQSWIELKDDASIARYGERYVYLGSELNGSADAIDYATWVVSVQAEPRWRLGDVIVHLEALTPELRAEVLGLTCGRHVEVSGMPQPTPAMTATGIVEGWTYTQWGSGPTLYERIVLHTSGLLESLAVMDWQDYPSTYLWSTHPAYLTWADLTEVPA